jgi:anti-sigma B factor antagonist
MALKITKHDVDGVTVVAFAGDIVLGEETKNLRETIKGLLAEGKKKIVLDMGKVTFIDSSGLGALVGVHHSANLSGASLRLSNLGAKFKELLQITRLLTVFDVSDNESEAIRAFAK